MNTSYDWVLDHIYLFVPAQALVAEFLATFQQFPPRHTAGSFSIQFALDKMTAPTSS